MTAQPEIITGEIVTAADIRTRTDSVDVRQHAPREVIAGKWLLAQPSLNTRAAYGRDIRAFFAWCDEFGIDTLRATRADIDAYRNFLATGGTGRNLSETTLARKLSALSSYYRYGCQEHPEHVPGNPLDGVKRPPPLSEAQSTWLDADEVARLFAAADSTGTWEAAMVRVLVYTGIRVSELCNARTSDLRMDGGHLTLAVTRKGRRRKRVAIPEDGAQALRRHLGGSTGPLFLGRRGGPVTRDEVAYRLDRLVRKAKIDKRITPHCLRHTAATLAREAGRDIRDVQQLLGHARIETTLLYEHARTGVKHSAAHAVAELVAKVASK